MFFLYCLKGMTNFLQWKLGKGTIVRVCVELIMGCMSKKLLTSILNSFYSLNVRKFQNFKEIYFFIQIY